MNDALKAIQHFPYRQRKYLREMFFRFPHEAMLFGRRLRRKEEAMKKGDEVALKMIIDEEKAMVKDFLKRLKTA